MITEIVGWIVTIVLVLFGITVLSSLMRDDWFTPNYPRRHKTKASITQHRRR